MPFPAAPALVPCSRLRPFASLESALQKIQPDTEVHLLEGQYPPLTIRAAPAGVTIRAAVNQEVTIGRAGHDPRVPLISIVDTPNLTLCELRLTSAVVGMSCAGPCPMGVGVGGIVVGYLME